MRNYGMLSDHDFELLAASLLSALYGGHWETFARGGDGGVDVRYSDAQGPHVVQCKHALGSTVSSLKTAAKAEKKKLDKLNPPPVSYRFWTTKALTPGNKTEIREKLGSWITADADIWGQEDLETALNDNPDVERAHVKLWVSGAGQFSAQVNAAIWERSRQLLADIQHGLPRYVETGMFPAASHMLNANRVLIISGPPGVGKTTLGRLLVAEAVNNGFEPIEISMDVTEGQQVIDRSKKQIFYYDDFLGSNFLSTSQLAKGEDKRLASFMRACQDSENSLFIMTTREYILRQALDDHEELRRAGLAVDKIVLQLENYTRAERGRILYNHLFHSRWLGDDQFEQLKANKNYRRIVDHRNYNPRLIEFFTMADPDLRTTPPDDFVNYAVSILENPETVWRSPFDRQLDPKSQSLVLLLACLDTQLPEREVERLLLAATAHGMCDAPLPGDFERMLKVLDDSFLSTTRGGPSGSELLVTIANPSVRDFVANLLVEERTRRESVIKASQYYEQVMWLFAYLFGRLEGAELEEFEREVCDALIRTFPNPVPYLHLSGLGFPLMNSTVEWSYASAASRLHGVLDVMESSNLCADLLVDELSKWIAIEEESWRSNPQLFDAGDCYDIVRILKSGRVFIDLPDSAEESVLALIAQLPSSQTKWSLLRELGDAYGVGPDYLNRWRGDFNSWLSDLLDASSDEVALETLDDAQTWAEELGVSYDERTFEAIHEQLALYEDERSDREYEQWKDSRNSDDGGTELDAIFER